MIIRHAKPVTVVKVYKRHGKLWIVYRWGNGKRFKQGYQLEPTPRQGR